MRAAIFYVNIDKESKLATNKFGNSSIAEWLDDSMPMLVQKNLSQRRKGAALHVMFLRPLRRLATSMPWR